MRPGPHQIATTGASDGQALIYDHGLDEYRPQTIPPSGVQTLVAGANVTVDATDPAHPIVSATASATAKELLMADGVASPPVPIETEAGDDWLYQD